MKLAYRVIDVTTVIIGVATARIEDGVRLKLPRGVRHATALRMVGDFIAAANKAMEGQPGK
jgi:hypothetical protein